MDQYIDCTRTHHRPRFETEIAKLSNHRTGCTSDICLFADLAEGIRDREHPHALHLCYNIHVVTVLKVCNKTALYGDAFSFPFSGLVCWWKKLPLTGIASARRGLCIECQVTIWIHGLVQRGGHTEVIPNPFAMPSWNVFWILEYHIVF